MRAFIEWLATGVALALVIWSAVNVFFWLPLPLAASWIGICFAVLGFTIGALVAMLRPA